MKTLTITVALFVTVFSLFLIHLATQAPSYEYDMNYVIPIDAHKMPKTLIPPAITPAIQGEGTPTGSETEARAEAVEPSAMPANTPARQPFRFDSWRASSPSEVRATE